MFPRNRGRQKGESKKEKMIDFAEYLDKPVVLITNEMETLREISETLLPGTTFLIRSFRFPKMDGPNQKYCLARNLKLEDLNDEDFIIYLNSMWKSTSNIDLFLNSHSIEKTNENKEKQEN